MSFEEFAAQTYQEAESGVYIVNGDTPIKDLDGLREFYELIDTQGALIVHQVSGVDSRWDDSQKLRITYCVSTNFGSRYDLVRGAMEAAAGSWERAANINLIHVQSEDRNCTPLNPNVVFDVRQVSGEPYLARAFFPDFPRSQRNVLIDTAAFGSIAPITMVGLLRHEIGHALGFRHEHTRPESGRCFEDDNWRELTAYDAGSVMHYPWCNGTNQGDLLLTALDQEGARVLYGAPGRENMMFVNRSTSGGRVLMTDLSDGVVPAEVQYAEAYGQSTRLDGFHDLGDLALAGDFARLGTDQVLFINRSGGGGRVLVADMSDGVAPSESRYWEAYGQSRLLDGWHDSGDLVLAGDFMKLGYDQVLFINRSGGGGRVLVADLSDGAAPAEVRYQEAYGQSTLLDGWLDTNDRVLVGDFAGLGYDQVMFINRSGGGGRVLVADFSDGAAPAEVRYQEAYGQSTLLDGWLDDGDRMLAGDFASLGYDQVLFLNASGGTDQVLIADFQAGGVAAVERYRKTWETSSGLRGWHDSNDLIFAGDFRRLGYDQALFINRSSSGGRVQVVDMSDSARSPVTRYLEYWGQSSLLDGWHDDIDLVLSGSFASQ